MKKKLFLIITMLFSVFTLASCTPDPLTESSAPESSTEEEIDIYANEDVYFLDSENIFYISLDDIKFTYTNYFFDSSAIQKTSTIVNDDQTYLEFAVIEFETTGIVFVGTVNNETVSKRFIIHKLSPKELTIKRVEGEDNSFQVLADGHLAQGAYTWYLDGEKITNEDKSSPIITLSEDKSHELLTVKYKSLEGSYIEIDGNGLSNTSKAFLLIIGVPAVLILLFLIIKYSIAINYIKEINKNSKRLLSTINKLDVALDKNDIGRQTALSTAMLTIIKDTNNLTKLLESGNPTVATNVNKQTKPMVTVIDSFVILELKLSADEKKQVLEWLRKRTTILLEYTAKHIKDKGSNVKPTKEERKKAKEAEDINDAKILNGKYNDARLYLESMNIIDEKK